MKQTARVLLLSIIYFLGLGMGGHAQALESKVLVVMSYEEPDMNPWCNEVRIGIDSVLGKKCAVDYFFMDTIINFDGGEKKAKEAYVLYQKNRYDGVITVDDNAQKMFVLPYLKNTVKTPVIFCGVNAEAAEYGYPASNVTGMLERSHFRESIALAKQLSVNIKKIGCIVKEGPSGNAHILQIEKESKSYLAEIIVCESVKTLEDVKNNPRLKECDAFLVASIGGILDDTGAAMSVLQFITYLDTTFSKPVIGANNVHVESGALCAVVKSGREQGENAAKKLLEALQGKPISDIPITRNYRGKRVINVSVLEKYGIQPRPITLIGSTLVKTRERK